MIYLEDTVSLKMKKFRSSRIQTIDHLIHKTVFIKIAQQIYIYLLIIEIVARFYSDWERRMSSVIPIITILNEFRLELLINSKYVRNVRRWNEVSTLTNNDDECRS